MSLEEIIDDLRRRLELARDQHREQRNSEHPDIRAKECAWGKIVGYSRALVLLSKLDKDTLTK